MVLRPGELLYIPRGWYHTVESTAAAAPFNLAINYWYESAPPMDSFFELAFEQLKSYAMAAERDDKRRGLT